MAQNEAKFRARALYAPLAVMCLFWAAFCAFVPVSAQAAQTSQFEVKGVAVDVTADSAQAARAEAQAQGEQKAFRQLLERLTPQLYHVSLPTLSGAELTPLILDFSVAEEKASSVRYIAKLDYHFRAQAVRDLLDAHGIPYAETKSKPVVIVPVYQAAGTMVLWDDPNLWRTAWNVMGEAGMDGLVPMALPVGDLDDLRIINAEQAIEGDMARLGELAKRYGASDAVVAHAILRAGSSSAPLELETFLTRFGSALQEQTVVKTFTALPGEAEDQFLLRAAQALKAQVEDNWKQDNLIQAGSQQALPILVRVNDLKEWVRVRDRLNGVAVVRRAELVLMRRGEVLMNLHFIGDVQQLALSLSQADLVLWEESGFWYLGQKPQN